MAQVYLENDGENKSKSVYSPDESQILYIAQNSNLHIINADGTNDRVVIDFANDIAVANWSPNGAKIIFSVNYYERSVLYSVNKDDSNLELLLKRDEGYIYNPTYSPIGQRILYVYREKISGTNYNYSLSTIDEDGTNEKTLVVEGNQLFLSSKWSLDGSRIIYILSNALHVIDFEGNNYYKLSNNYSGLVSTATWID